MRCILVGNYGDGNIGDEALKEAILAKFPEVEWTVLSARPREGELPRLPGGIRSFLRMHWLQTIKAMRQCDAIVFGGGSLFTDSESLRACFLWWIHARVATTAGVPVFLAYQGIGPFHTAIGEWLARDAVRHAAFVSVRDSASAQRVNRWGLNTNVIQTFDPVFAAYRSSMQERTKKVLTIIPRWNSTPEFLALTKDIAAREQWDAIQILLMQPDAQEQMIAERLLFMLPGSPEIVLATTFTTLCDAVALSALVITQRYHGALAAIALERECRIVPQKPNDKLDELLPLLTLPPQERALKLKEEVEVGDIALRNALS